LPGLLIGIVEPKRDMRGSASGLEGEGDVGFIDHNQKV